jgi:ferredoxin
MPQTVRLLYFSPTGTTRAVCEAVAEGLGTELLDRCNLTPPEASCDLTLTEGVAVIGVPVYAGRVPELFLERVSGLSASGVPAVLIGLYGNRAYEDALVELRDVAAAKGFRVIAAGAFIGEHSYSTPDRPIAGGRPDAPDLELAREFGRQVAAKLMRGDLATPTIRGDVPYRERKTFGGIAPETDRGKCTLCGACAAVCPTGIVSVADRVVTRAASCIMCCACIRACRFEARIFDHPVIEERRALLLKNCAEPKQPEIFI